MLDFYLRTEDIQLQEINKYFSETGKDREIINFLKSSSPIILEGSRGTGKSFLIRVAETELNQNFEIDKVLPVYITFVASSLVHTDDPDQFKHWMLAHICYKLLRALRRKGLLIGASPATALLSRSAESPENLEQKFSKIYQAYENSYKTPTDNSLADEIPDLIYLKDVIEEVCQDNGVNRICFFFDEAVHIFRPNQQRQFFTLFRDLRSPYICCKAAVYPGVTSFGSTFEMTHDARLLRVERDVSSSEYLDNMLDIVLKQANDSLKGNIERNRKNFNVLAYAASGNPRVLLKTLFRCFSMKTKDVGNAIKDFYRTDIWAEHTSLGEKYLGHKSLVDWGRDFIENQVIPDTQDKNERRAAYDESTCYFWIHRDVPEVVKESLRLMEYTGIVRRNGEAVRGTASRFGTRYELKLGCLLALEANPVSAGVPLANNLKLERVTEYGMNSRAFQSAPQDFIQQNYDNDLLKILNQQLDKSIDILDLTKWQKNKLRENRLLIIRNILDKSEEDMKAEISGIGKVRSRQIRNAAIAAILEYLSG